MYSRFVTITIAALIGASLFAGEFLVRDEVYRWDASATEGKNSWVFNDVGPSNWISPEDYYNGQFYFRYEVISQPTSRACKAQFVIWQDWNYPTSWLEQASGYANLYGPGSVGYANSSPSSWWQHDGHPLDFSRPDDFYKFGVMVWSENPSGRIAKYLADRPEVDKYDEIWADRFDWFPLEIRIMIVAVSAGSTFSGWEGYLNGTTPPYQSTDTCDFYDPAPTAGALAVQAEDMTLSDYFTQDLDGASEGSVAALYNELDGSFNETGTISTSFSKTDGLYDVSIVYVDENDGASTFELLINGEQEVTWQGVEQECKNKYTRITFEDIPLYTGDIIAITGDKVDGAYAKIDYLDFDYVGIIPPEVPSFTIDYDQERTQEQVSDSYQYSTDGVSWITGSGAYVDLLPGADMYFRVTGSDEQQHLEVPERLSTPNFTIDYLNEQTHENVNTDCWVALSADLSGAVQGTGAPLELNPDEDLYFQKPATASAFASEVQHLQVPERASVPTFSIDYTARALNADVTSDFIYAQSNDITTAANGVNGSLSLVPEQDIYMWRIAAGGSPLFPSEVQFIDVPGAPGIGTFSIDYANKTTLEPVAVGVYYATQSDMSGAVEGADAVVDIEPGTDMFFQVLPGVSSFGSDVSVLDVPDKPQFTLLGGTDQTIDISPASIQLNIEGDTSGFTLAEIVVENGSIDSVGNHLTLFVSPATEGEVSLYFPPNMLEAGNFESDTLMFVYQEPSALEGFEKGSLRVFPNPTDGNLNFQSAGAMITRIQVYSYTGVLVYGKEVQDVSGTFNLDVPGGSYYVKVFNTAGEVHTQKIIVR